MAGIILTGVDDSDAALRAADRAATLAVALGAELLVLSAFNMKLSETLQTASHENEPEAMSNAYKDLDTKNAEKAARTAARVTEGLRQTYPDLKVTSRATAGAPGVALLSEADRINADIIVVGNRRVQGPTRILGSIARTIASGTNCDLYVVNTHQR